MKRIPLAIHGLMIAFALYAPLQSQAADLNGKWAWTIETPDGNSFESVMVAKQVASKLTGYVGRPGEDDRWTIKQGKIESNQVSFTVTPIFGDSEITVEYLGKHQDDAIVGTVRVVEFDAEFPWQAKRRVIDVNPAGSWEFNLTTPNGNALEATLDLVYDKTKLTGELIADNWTVAIEEAKIEGNTIQFKTTNPNNPTRYTATGIVKGNKMSGRLSFKNDAGDQVELAWSATK